MSNYFRLSSKTPVLLHDQHRNQYINVAPLLLAMEEVCDNEYQSTPQGLAIIVGDALRYLSTNVAHMDKEMLPAYNDMMTGLHDIRDMFDAMTVVK